MKTSWAALLLAASVLWPHWPRERADFAYDDRDFIVANQSVHSLRSALSAWRAPFPPDQPERGLYRPLTALSYALDFQLSGGDARGFHRTNVVLYALVVALAYALALAYGRSRDFALAFALLFSVHPVHCDAVDAIAGRSELLCLLFSLVALLAFLRARRPPQAGVAAREGRWLAVSVGAFALACTAKETGSVLPAILALHVWVLPAGARRGRLAELARLWPHAAVLALYLAVRVAALGHFGPSEPVLRDAALASRLHTLGSVFLEDLRLLVFPQPLQIDFHYQRAIGVAAGASARSLAGLGLFAATALALAGLAWRAGREARGQGAGPAPASSDSALAACALALFLGFLLPVSHLLDIGALMAERFLFSPSLGWVLLCVLAGTLALERGVSSARARHSAALALVGGLALVGAERSATRAAEWRDEVALWTAAERDLPDSPEVLANLAAAQLVRGQLDAAVAVLERGLARHPQQPELLGNLGLARLQQGRLEEARAAFESLLSRNPADFVTWSNLASLEARRNHHSDALPLFARALEINPNYADAQRALASTQQQLALAHAFLRDRRSEAERSGDAQLLGLVARACEAIGDRVCAREFAERARRAGSAAPQPQGST